MIPPRGSLAPLSSAPPLEPRLTPCTTQRLAPSPAAVPHRRSAPPGAPAPQTTHPPLTAPRPAPCIADRPVPRSAFRIATPTRHLAPPSPGALRVADPPPGFACPLEEKNKQKTDGRWSSGRPRLPAHAPVLEPVPFLTAPPLHRAGLLPPAPRPATSAASRGIPSAPPILDIPHPAPPCPPPPTPLTSFRTAPPLELPSPSPLVPSLSPSGAGRTPQLAAPVHRAGLLPLAPRSQPRPTTSAASLLPKGAIRPPSAPTSLGSSTRPSARPRTCSSSQSPTLTLQGRAPRHRCTPQRSSHPRHPPPSPPLPAASYAAPSPPPILTSYSPLPLPSTPNKPPPISSRSCCSSLHLAPALLRLPPARSQLSPPPP